jgi:DNA-binding beta-propeller fold protein YncE
VLAVLLTSQESPVGEAPPLTPVPGASTRVVSAAVLPEPARPVVPPAPKRDWKAREIPLGDVHPLDLVFSKDGKSLYVSADDATVREYLVATGELVHKASVPAKGDRLELLGGRYLAVLRRDPRVSRIPVADVTQWDRDPMLLDVGAGPGDVLELPDGSIVTASTEGHRISRFGLPSGQLLADLSLPQSTGQLFLVRAEGRTQLAALGGMTHAGRPAGGWIDLFDPEEKPFGATRRSVAVGRDPRGGAVSSDGSTMLLPDRVSNAVTVLRIGGMTESRTVEVGQEPIAAFVLAGDRWGLTLSGVSRTASVMRLDVAASTNEPFPVTTLLLPGAPRDGVPSPDRSVVFVSLGGLESPPRGRGVAVIGGDPPEVVASLPTGEGASSLVASGDGKRAAIANYFSKSITVIE